MKWTNTRYAALGLLALASMGAVAQADKGTDAARARAVATFKENGGQWDARAKFLSQSPGLDYWVTGDGFVVDQYKYVDSGKPYEAPSPFKDYDKVAGQDRLRRKGNVVAVNFVGGSGRSLTQAYGPTKGSTDYFLPGKTVRNVHSYQEAVVKSVYPGIHTRHYRLNGDVRYDLIVDPGANPNLIEMSFQGAKGMTSDGKKLTLQTSIGDLNIADLKVYQPVGNSARHVDASFYKTANGTVKVQLGAYDPRLPLVIDPRIFGSYVGSDPYPQQPNPDERVNAVTAESNGTLYMAGSTSSITFPVSAGPYDKFNVQGVDTFINQMDGNAYTVTYSAVMGGSGTDNGLGIGFDEDTRALWIGGTTNSADFAGAVNVKSAGVRAWVGKFTFGSGSVTPDFVRYINEPGALTTATFKKIQVTASGHVYVAGNSDVTTLLGQGFVNYLPTTTTAAKKAGWVMQLDSSGNVGYKLMVAGKVDVNIGNMTVNKLDEVAVVGTVTFAGVEDTGFAADPSFGTTPGVFDGVTGVFQGGRWLQNVTAFVVRVKEDGTTYWAATLGGADDDSANGVAMDADQNVFVTGFTKSFNFQRTPGAYNQNFSTNQMYLTKLTADGSALGYSTGLRSTGNVFPTALAVDGRGNCYVGGVVAFTITGLFTASPSIPGSIVTTDRANGDPETAEDPDYDGGDTSVNGANVGDPDQDPPSTTDGFISVMNPAGSAFQYSTYIGNDTEDRVTDVYVDNFGGCWIGGWSQVVWNNPDQQPPVPSTDNGIGIPPFITANAFKSNLEVGQPSGNQPDFALSNGWIIKARVVLPRLTGVTVAPTSIPGGFNAQSTITVSLEDPAPVGGVSITLTTSNATATSFDPNSSLLTTDIVVPEGQTTASATIYSLPVVSNQTSSIKAILDNDFKETRLTILPWLSDMSVAPQVTQGGNNLVVSVNITDFAPAGGLPVILSTDRPDVILLPNPPQVVVPQNAKNAQITIPTMGVPVSTTATVTASFLGVNKTKSVTLNPATLKDFTFNPSRVNRGDDSTATVRFFGKTGSARTVTISQVAGDAGAKINGQALPVQISVPAQTGQITFTVTAPLTISSGFTTLKADDGSTSVNGTLNIDPIDILDIVLSPGTDVTAGTVITGQVSLTRPAGPNGLTVSLSNSNANAGTLSDTQVTIPAGQTTSSSFTFNTSIVNTDTTTNIHATKPGFSDKYRTVIVRGIKATLTLSPTTVIGFQQNSTGTVSLTRPAPPGGLTLSVTSSDTSAATVPAEIVVPEAQSSVQFTCLTRRTPVQKKTTISVVGSALVKDSKVLTVNPPALLSLSFSPSTVLGGLTTKGTITLSTQATTGTVITLTAAPAGIISIPASVTVTAGLSQFSFLVPTKAVAVTTAVTVTAKLFPTQVTGSVIVRSPGIGNLTFNPPRVNGGGNSLGTVTIDGPAPPGGITVTVTSGNTNYARVKGSGVLTIPAGKLSANFQVETSKVSRTVAVQFTATSSAGSTSGNLYVDP
ncbi:MAG: hypothetical protein JST30_11945 [Armatimonadetes bacterium]|nr:hypothetical protein [Armatimonadota bacterium]